MKINDVKKTLMARGGLKGSFGSLTPAQGLEVMGEFYKSCPVEDCDDSGDGDMFLYERGVFSFTGLDEHQISFTRQMIPREEDETWQLRLTFSYPPETVTGDEGVELWCQTQDDYSDFHAEVEGDEGFQILMNQRALKVDLDFEEV